MSKVSSFLNQLPLTADEIALKARLSSERVRAFMAGEDASLADLRALARGLKVPLRSFAGEAATNSDLNVLFRSTVSQRADRGVESVASFVQAALELLPARSAPPAWLSSFEYTEDSYEAASRLADEFRERVLPDRIDDPMSDLPQILNMLGIIQGKLETSRFEGASLIIDGYPFIFVSPRFSGRMLFTLAHELGHILTHHRDQKRSVHFDLAGQVGSGLRYKYREESFVNAFASVLLMPSRGVGIVLRQIREALKIRDAAALGDVEILYLSRFYGVSFEVAARRCEDLELLPVGGAKSLADYLKKNFGGAEKRAAALRIQARSPIEFPSVSRNLLDVAIRRISEGRVSVGWVADRLNCTISEIYASRVSNEGPGGPHH